MIRRLILFELRYWLRQPMFLGAVLLAFVFGLALVVLETGGGAGALHVNSPNNVYGIFSGLSFLWLPLVSAFVNATAIRDHTCRTAEIVFSTVVTRRQYVLGRFLGSTLVALVPPVGISLGIVLGSWVPYGDPLRFGPNDPVVHLQAYVWFAVCNILFQSAVMFAVGTLVRSTVAAFVTSIALVVLNVIATAYATEVDQAWLAALLDPFGVQALDEVTRYWSVQESNTAWLPITGPLLRNRLLWLGIAALVFAFGYARFSFTERRTAARMRIGETKEDPSSSVIPAVHQTHGRRARLLTFLSFLRSDLRDMLRGPVLWIITGLGLLMVLVALSEVDHAFGTHAWPVTSNVSELLRGIAMFFNVAFITYYSGELFWRDRDARLDGIMHALPIRSRSRVLAHGTAICLMGIVILCAMSVAGMITQLVAGYTRLEPGLYLAAFVAPGTLFFVFWTAVALSVHSLAQNKYLGFGLFVLLFAANMVVWSLLKIGSNLVVLNGAPRLFWSDMNAFGPFLLPWLFFRAYWLAFAALLLFLTGMLFVRGGETSWRWRMRIARTRLRRSWGMGAAVAGVWLLMMAFGIYNVRVLNEPSDLQDAELLQAEYERTYAPLEGTALAHITAVDITVELDPEVRGITYHATLTLKNKNTVPVDTLWFSLPDRMDLRFTIQGAEEVVNDSAHYVRMFRLRRPLPPGDTLRVGINSSWQQHGFGNDVDFVELVENGTFLNNGDLLPSIGYQAEAELTDPAARRKHGLPPGHRMAALSGDPHARRFNMVMPYADHVRFACTIGTAMDQTAIAPGTLVEQWQADGKRWFRYVVETPILNFWSILSARYTVAREHVGRIDLEVYHHPAHGINVPRMLKAMRDAIAYASANFSPYQHKVARIVEFPRYRRFAQSFPGTMPYSEAIGFITDLRDTTGIDMVYYVVAHEVAHQWWGHQVVGPRMQGATMMNESMAQYTALMVLEKEYGRAAMRKFLKYERDTYLRGRGKDGIGEQPLLKVEEQNHIHYNKGSVVMYMLRDHIGEERMNRALRAFVDSFAFKEAPYPTALDLEQALLRVTPDSMHYLVRDGLERITFYRNAVAAARLGTNADGTYAVTATIACAKFHTDSLGKETEVAMNDWIDVAVEHDGGEMKQRVRLRSGENTVAFQVPKRPLAVVVDPDHLFFDREGDDDRCEVEVK